MTAMLERLRGSKTAWMALAILLAAMEEVLAGRMTAAQGLQLAATAVLAMLLRDAIARVQSMQANESSNAGSAPHPHPAPPTPEEDSHHSPSPEEINQ